MSFLFKKSKKETSQSTGESKAQDKEEDGFVVVGQTQDEINTLTPDKPEYNQDLPPIYQVCSHFTW